MRNSFLATIVAAVLSLSVAAAAQTTQPARDTTWLQQFSSDLQNGKTMPASIQFGRFEKNQPQSSRDLQAAIGSRSIIIVQSYTGVPATLASDLATSLRDQSTPGSTKRLFTPRTPDECKHADDVAASWIQSSLKPGTSDLVGVLLFCTDISDAADHPSDLVAKPAAPLMVLVDAENAGANGPRIRRVQFGDPRPQ